MRRTVLSLAAAGVAAGLALAPAAAMAAPAVYVFTWNGGELVQYTDVEAGTGDVIATTEAYEVTGLDVDASGAGFAVDFDFPTTLYSVDVLTGAVEDLGGPTFDGEPIAGCTGLDFTAGVLTIVCDFVPGQDAASMYLTVDTETLETTLVVASDIRASSIATDPTDGQLYGFGYNGEILAISDGTVDELGFVSGFTTIWGADFSDDGSLWGTVEDTAVPVEVGDFDFVPAAMHPGGDSDEYAENITVVELSDPAPAPAPQLAATGSDTAPVLFGAVALMAVGAALATAVVVRRRAA